MLIKLFPLCFCYSCYSFSPSYFLISSYNTEYVLLSLQALELVRLGLMFPIYCVAYMIAPKSSSGVFMKNPFVKFICHSASFLCFLLLLACASQRLERITMQVPNDFGSLLRQYLRKPFNTLHDVCIIFIR